MRQIENPTVFRENIRKKLEYILGNYEIATNLEKGIFNSSLGKAKKGVLLKNGTINISLLFISIFSEPCISI